MTGQTSLRSAPAGILLLAMMAAAIMFTAAPPISGDETTLPTITISATGGVTTVTEGQDITFTITADTAPAAPLEVHVGISVIGSFTNIPVMPNIELGRKSGYEVRTATIPAGTTQAVLVIMTEDDMVEEEGDGSVHASLQSRPHYTVGNPSRGSLQVKDNDIVAPSKMDLPTLLPADGRLEVFWEEPAHTSGRKISEYLISWASPSTSASYRSRGDRRHISITGSVTNGETQTIQIQACKGVAYCSEKSDAVRATPTDSGPTMTGPTSKTLPEESTGTVGQFTAVPSTPGPITWRLGGSFEYFTATVNPDGTMTLTMNEGVSFEDLQRSQHMLRVLVVATDSTTDQATSVIPVTVTITDVDETPTFAESIIVKPPYVVGTHIQGFVLPVPKADERPITYSMLTVDPDTGLDLAQDRQLPPGISLSQGRVIDGIPTQAGTFTATYAATDVDGDVGTLDIQFKVVDIHTPTVAIQIADQAMTLTDSPRTIDLADKFQEPDGDVLTHTAVSDNTGVVTVAITGTTLTLTPVAAGEATITVTATDPSGRSASQKFTVTVAPAANNSPTVAIQIDDQHMSPTDSPRDIELVGKFEDPDTGDTLRYTGTSGNASVVTTGIAGSTLTLTPVAVGTATITVTAADPSGLSVSQEFMVTVASAAIAISPSTGGTIAKGSGTTFLVTGTGLDPAETYSLAITLAEGKASFDKNCSTTMTNGELPAGLTGARALIPVPPEPRAKSFQIYGCKLGEVEITATLVLGTDELNQVTVTATVTGLPDKPEITAISTADGTITLQIELGHGVDSYVIQEGTPPTELPSVSYTKTPPSTGDTGPTTSTAIISGLTNGVEYTYTVVSTSTHDSTTSSTTSDGHVVALPTVILPTTITITRQANTEIEINEGDYLGFTLTADRVQTSNLAVHLKITEEPDRAWLSETTSLTRHPDGYWRLQINIPANQASADFNLPIARDGLDEPDGNITVQLVTNPNYQFGSMDSLRHVVIQDADTLLPPSQVYANGNVVDGTVSIWWKPSAGATNYDLRYALETCPHSSRNQESVCTPETPSTVSELTTTSKELTAGSSQNDQLAISNGAYSSNDPTGVYRLEVRAINEIGAKSEWSTPAFIYPTRTPPVAVKTDRVLGSQLPQIATAHLYGYQLNNTLTFVVCDGTIPTGERSVNLNAVGIKQAIKAWETAVLKDTETSLISTNELIGPLTEDACKPPDLSGPLVPEGHNAVMFLDDDAMKKARCGKDSTYNQHHPRSCWRSRSQLSTAHDQLAGTLTTLSPITAGTIILRNAPVPNGDPRNWNAPGHNPSCIAAQHVITHEVGHAFGIGNAGLGLVEYHPRNSTLSIMSDGPIHQTTYCKPQPYDVVALTALYQSR